MAWQKRFFEKNKPVHVVSRAVVDIFKNKEDCYRFIFQFYASNLGKRGFNVLSKDAIKIGQALLWGEKIPSRFIIKEHPPLVDLIDFAQVINHYHFYLLPKIDKAIPILISKLNNGFAKSFNFIHNRKDAVFGSRYKGILIRTDFQSSAVTRYISIINSLDVFQWGWREKGLKNPEKAFEFLKKFEFSSFPDRIGERKSRILAPDEVLERFPFGGGYDSKREFQKFTKEFLKERSSQLQYFLE